MNDPGRDPFYVGYQPKTQPVLGRFLARTTGGILVAGLVTATILASRQRPPAPSVFEYGVVRDFRGLVWERPYPMLLVQRPGSGDVVGYLLAGQGKHGAAAVAGHGGQVVQLGGTLIYRADRTMVEIGEEVTFEPAANGLAQVSVTELGPATLHGEIVDSKCHLGAMNPGDGPTHRLCAVRCLLGGLPPLLAVPGQAPVILAGPDGSALPGEVLRGVGLRVRVSGRLERFAGWRVLRVETWSPAAGAPE